MPDSPVVLITGGATGIGAAAARRLLDTGHRVVVTGRRKERLDRFAEEVGSPDQLLTLPGDAAEPAAVEGWVAATLRVFGRLDAVVANAGRGAKGDVTDGDPAEWREMILTNVLGPPLLVKAALPALRDSHGRVVLIGSVVGQAYTPGGIYGPTKWAVHGLAGNLRMLLTHQGVGVTLVVPGLVETEFGGGGGPPNVTKLGAEHIGAAIAWAIDQPEGVDVNTVVVRPMGQPL
jgi:NADP-dependent 3-hydroxy acid dehydrogenase YdfG